MQLHLWQDAVIMVAGMLAGTINAVVGSGTLITFPVLLAVGLPLVTANVSNTLGLVPGSLSGAFGYRATLGLAGLQFVTQVDQLKQAEDSSIDFYTFLRSDFYQTRRADLREALGLPSVVESPATGTSR